MIDKNKEKEVTFYELQWDTEYFGVTSAKAILHKPLTQDKWNDLKDGFKDYKFISIVNNNSEPINSQFIAKDTPAFLADVNIQFKKQLRNSYENPKNIEIYQAFHRNERIIEIANFQFSKFTEDPKLDKSGGDKVYHQWIINSFEEPDKFYALSQNAKGEINGFLLHSYSDDVCIIELIAVSQDATNGGVGTNLFKAVEHEAYQRGCKEIRVGTQVRNMGAINFYHKAGCKQIGCHQVYHLWNL